ncbi:MAG TPA: MBL fold metallo-hydrolase [Pirellulaceae bacterium]|nr:MBL fold metallo-hydrolase [Pirellulaceae bacterium]
MTSASPSPQDRPLAAQPLEVAERCWMIGYRNPSSLLQCNTYLRQFAGARQGTSICIDPGSQFDSAVIESNLATLTGNGGLDYITVNHQDPDVTGNLPALCERNPAATVMVTADTWRLVQHLRVRPGQLNFAPALGSRVLSLAGGIVWQPVPTPFCHFRGAMAFYDPEARILFSGDLFGGLNLLGRVHLFAEEADWAGIAHFHQIYMPTREVLRYAVRQIRALTPAVEIIAPQHGHVIAGELVPLFLERLENLLVGSDLLALELDEKFTAEYGELVDLLIGYAREVMGAAEVERRLIATTIIDGLEECLAADGLEWRVTGAGYSCATRVFARLAADEEHSFVSELRDRVLRFCSQRSVPVPPVGWGLEEGSRQQSGVSRFDS